MIRLILEKRKQLEDESTVSYINEVESLCRRIDKNMSQEEVVRNIMKGLRPNIARYIGIMNNKNLNELKENVRKYETIEFMITGHISQTLKPSTAWTWTYKSPEHLITAGIYTYDTMKVFQQYLVLPQEIEAS